MRPDAKMDGAFFQTGDTKRDIRKSGKGAGAA